MKINPHTIHRYVNAFEGYKKRLASGYRILSTKTAKKLGGEYKQGDSVPLTEVDIKRINKEMTILEGKIKAAGFSSLIGADND
tara:strand:+ start:4068 stop:4316 length:249 start_codon:yes stop_codon:yes gene_type:complete